jgi:hypothetical protein
MTTITTEGAFMRTRVFAQVSLRKALAVAIGLTLALGGAPGLFAQASTATITGVVLDPAGKPAFGFKAVVIDTATNTKYTSSPTDAAGLYTMSVPVGGRYKLDSVIADDGVTRLAVQDVAPVSVLAAGTTLLNVRFTTTPAAGTQTATAAQEKEKKKDAVPWYKRPGPIVGMVLGGVAIAALALSAGGGDDNNGNVASASRPTD